MNDIENQLIKLQFHVSCLAQDMNRNSISALVVAMNLSSDDFDVLHDIFSKFAAKLENKEIISWKEFESDINLYKFCLINQPDYTCKYVIDTFYATGLWESVCNELLADKYRLERNGEKNV